MPPAKLQTHLQNAIGHHRAGRLDEAALLYRQARVAAPKNFEAWHYGGMIALSTGHPSEAAALLEAALKLKPASAQTALCLGVARIALGELAAAESVLRALTAAQPDNAEAWHHLALVHKTAGSFDHAITAHRRAVTLKPGYAQGWLGLGTTLSMTSRQTEALACFDRAIALDPERLRARLGRAMVLFKSHRVAEAAKEFAAVIARESRQFEARSHYLMALNCLPDLTRDEVFAAHQAFGMAAGEALPREFSCPPEPQRRLRVAFLSPDLREHSIAYFLEPLLQHLDRSAFEILLYHDHPKVDATSARLRSYAMRWRHFAGQTDHAVEATIRQDAPDILIDLAGHTGLNRLPLLARRLAPVQISYLGYPNTTGVRAIDYRLVDAITDPDDADAFHVETLVRFAPTAWAYLPPADDPAATPPPSAACTEVTFGSFNNFTKATDAMLQTWGRLLREVPRSRLLIKANALGEATIRDSVLERLRTAGLDRDRVEVLGRTGDTRSHLALYGRVDVALDMFPYHGTTTTCEALWMGVPVVTLAGDRHASRVGVSLLNAVGHPEWIARSPEDYIRIAANLAADASGRTRLRYSLRDEILRSPLSDHAGQAARFGGALRGCWARWCARNRSAVAA